MTKICLIGIDGLRLDIARQEAATFRGLVENGSLAAMRVDVPTISGPSWTTLLTGASYAEHRIVDNTFAAGRHAELPDFLSRIAATDPALRTFAAAGWPPLVDPQGPGPVIHSRDADQRSGRHTVIIRSGEGDAYRTADAQVAEHAVAALADGTDASFVYLGEADAAGHAFGGLSPEYRDAVARIDDHLRSLVATIQERAETAAEDWTVVITTDHGHLDEGGHGGGTELETTSFALAACYGPTAGSPGAGPKDWPETMRPVELTRWLVDLAAR